MYILLKAQKCCYSPCCLCVFLAQRECENLCFYYISSLLHVFTRHRFLLRNTTWPQDGRIALGSVEFLLRLALRVSKAPAF